MQQRLQVDVHSDRLTVHVQLAHLSRHCVDPSIVNRTTVPDEFVEVGREESAALLMIMDKGTMKTLILDIQSATHVHQLASVVPCVGRHPHCLLASISCLALVSTLMKPVTSRDAKLALAGAVINVCEAID